MNIDSIQDSTRVVLSELRHGSIIPGNRAEMWRELFLLPGADLRGSAFGKSLYVEGPDVNVEASIYVRESIKVAESDKEGIQSGNVTFGSCVTTPDSILVDPVSFRVRFLSNIYAGIVNLNSSIVYGNVYARSGVIRDSVILGGVFCRGNLSLENCIVTTFRANSVNIGQKVSLLFPIAMAEKPIKLDYPVRALSFYNLSDSQDSNDNTGGSVLLDERDVYKIGDQMIEENEDEEHKNNHLYVLSMDQRVMDAEKVIEHFRGNRKSLEFLTLIDHMPSAQKDQIQKGGGAKLEDRLMGLVEREDIPEVDGYSTIEDIFVRADMIDTIKSFVSEDVVKAMKQLSEDRKSANEENSKP